MTDLIKIAAERKKISIEQATAEITAIYACGDDYKIKLKLSSYLEDATHPNHNKNTPDIDPIYQIKE